MNVKVCITSSNAPPAIGPYSHAVAVEIGKGGRLLFVSGQCPFAKDGSGATYGSIEEETALALDNLRTVLEDAGSGLEHIVKITVYLKDMTQFQAFNKVYKEFFPMDFPARTCIEVARLPLDIQVEVDATAIVPE